MVLVGVGAVMAVVAWVIVLLSPPSEHPLESGTQDTAASGPLTTLAGAQNAIPAAAQTAGHSIVELEATTSHGTVLLVGVAVAEGGLVATTADPLSGLEHLDMVGPGGQLQAASVVATDKTSDVALVDVPEDLPVAPFADDSTLHERGPRPRPDLRAGGRPYRGAALHARCGHRRRRRPSRPGPPRRCRPSPRRRPRPPSWPASRCSTPPGRCSASCTTPTRGPPPPPSFPSGLVVGVADDLRSQNRVVHGWLGVEGTDASDGRWRQRWRRCSPAARRPDAWRWVSSLWP